MTEPNKTSLPQKLKLWEGSSASVEQGRHWSSAFIWITSALFGIGGGQQDSGVAEMRRPPAAVLAQIGCCIACHPLLRKLLRPTSRKADDIGHRVRHGQARGHHVV